MHLPRTLKCWVLSQSFWSSVFLWYRFFRIVYNRVLDRWRRELCAEEVWIQNMCNVWSSARLKPSLPLSCRHSWKNTYLDPPLYFKNFVRYIFFPLNSCLVLNLLMSYKHGRSNWFFINDVVSIRCLIRWGVPRGWIGFRPVDEKSYFSVKR